MLEPASPSLRSPPMQFIAIMSESYVEIQKLNQKRKAKERKPSTGKDGFAALGRFGPNKDEAEEVDYDVFARLVRFVQDLSPRVVLLET